MWALIPLVLASTTGIAAAAANSTYTNPVIPGWHSDPSCVFVAESYNRLFCTTSSFLSFPGIPIYASDDFLSWNLASNVLSRPSQLPWIANTTNQSQMDGLWASTLRYRNGTFYLITSYVSIAPRFTARGILFNSSDPYRDDAWSDPIHFDIGDIDPDLFWDDDGTVYVSYAGTSQQTIDLATGLTGEPYRLWNGSGGRLPEGPHIYRKDGYYYLLISEGGTELGHQVTIARSRNAAGPYENYPGNPILTNTNTTEYFQTVGHADLFQDTQGNWWGIALATRSGPAWENYPMGRETVLFPVTWEKDAWPIFDPIRGRMSGWPLPPSGRDVPGDGPSVTDPDVFDFEPGSPIPSHFVYWRFPPHAAFKVSPDEQPSSLRLSPSRSNLTGSAAVPAELSFVARRQTDTRFTYSVDIEFKPTVEGEEAGVTIFLTQFQHVDLSIIRLPGSRSSGEQTASFRMQTTVIGKENQIVPPTVIRPIPAAWQDGPIRLQIQAVNDTHYSLSAAAARDPTDIESFGYVPATIVSGGTGPFTGTILGVYATSNDGAGTAPAYFRRWRYTGQGQKIGDDEYA